MIPKLTKLWINESKVDGECSIRADFSNDRHYMAVIRRPCEPEQIANALVDMAHMIATDPSLTPNVK